MPHRGVAAGKSRLSAVMPDAARGELNRWLLARTLHIAAAWLGEAQRCMVVSPCAQTLALATDAGAMALPEQPSTPGLNIALAHAAATAATLGAQQVLVLPCDLPLLDCAALQAMTSLRVDGAEVIAPDRHGSGTNALLVDAGVRDFAFGAGSYARHCALAAARGSRALACAHAALAFDLDTVEDFWQWQRSGGVMPSFLADSPLSVCRRGSIMPPL